jgi:HSP90 family molecular chaperone
VKRKRKGPRRRQQRRLFLNDVKVVWLHSPKEGTDEEYLKFYHSLAKV